MSTKFTEEQSNIARGVLSQTGGNAEASHRILKSKYGLDISASGLRNLRSRGSISGRPKAARFPQIPNGSPTPFVMSLDPEDVTVRSAVVRRLQAGPVSPEDMAKEFKCSEASVRQLFQDIADSGYHVVWRGGSARISKDLDVAGIKFADASPLDKGGKTFGVLSDTHLCSVKERLDVVEAAYDHYVREGVTHVYHAGNIVDGEGKFNRHELKVHGITDQALYCLDHYPQRKGIRTYFISADDHEGWWHQREGLDFGRYLVYEAQERGRDDLVWMGYEEADVELKGQHASQYMKIMHPGGGTAYALSYTTQKIVESLQGGEKPSVLIVGHYHKAIYHMVRNVHTLQAGCCQDQTIFQRKKKLEAHVGFWTVSIKQDERGAVRQFSPTFTSFFDQSYHSKASIG